MRLDRKEGRRVQSTVEAPELKKINQDYQAGDLPFENALALVQDLRDRLARQAMGHKKKPLTNQENLKLLEAYWRKEYADRDLADPTAMKSDLARALRVLGPLTLYTADKVQIYEKIKKAGLGKNAQRRVISRLNQILRFANRDFRLRLPRQEFPNVRYINASEMEALATYVGGLDGHLIRLAFSSGLRMGELFALRKENLDEAGHLQVVAQIKKDGSRSLPKTRKTRRVLVLPYGKESLKVWINTPVHERPRQRHYHEIMARACKKLWPDNPDKRIRFHDLRHSFAIEMLRLGESFTIIAGALGNSVQVCQTYYTGFELKSETLEALDARLSEKFKAQAKVAR